MNRQCELVGQRHQDAAARRAVELGHHQARHIDQVFEYADLADGVLPGGGIEHQQDIVRCLRVDFLDDPNNLRQFGHKVGFVVQPSGGVDEQQVVAVALRSGEGVKGEACGIGSQLFGHHLAAAAFAPDIELFDGGGAKGVTGGQQH